MLSCVTEENPRLTSFNRILKSKKIELAFVQFWCTWLLIKVALVSEPRMNLVKPYIR